MNRKFKSFLSMFMSTAIAVNAVPLTASAETAIQGFSVDDSEAFSVSADRFDGTSDDEITVAVEQPEVTGNTVVLDEVFRAMHFGTNEATSGNCGDSATWSVSGTTLTISGSGDMIDFATTSEAMNSEWWTGYSSTITKIVIGEGITSIGDYAFYYFENLTDIILPSTLKEIGAHAFDSCSDLASATSKATGLVKIGDSAFSSCSVFGGFAIPATVSYIGESAFNGVKNIKSVTIPSAVDVSLGANAFYGCTGLETVTIEDGVAAIPDGAFGGCEKLEELTLPDSVLSIGANAFNGCAALSNINSDTELFTVPDTIAYIGESAFAGCKSLKSLIIEGNAILGISAFASCENLAAVKISGNTPEGKEAVDTVIWPAAFRGCTNLKVATLDANVTAIGIDAFRDTPLETISLPSSLISIDYGAFSNTRLSAITIPDSVTNLGGFNVGIFGSYKYDLYGVFAGCELLKTVKINNTEARTQALTIGELSFDCCTALEDLDISGTGVICDEAFRNCTSLKKVTLPKELIASTSSSVKDTNDYELQFTGCTALSEVTIEDGAGALGNMMFAGCTNLVSIVIPSSVKANTKSFYNNTSLVTAKVYCPTIDVSMFEGARSLTTVILGGDADDKGAVDTINKKAFANCSSIVNITLPETISVIQDEAFASCTSLKSITVPTAVTTLSQKLFNGCSSLTAVKYSSELTKIGNYAFCNCTALTGVTYDASAIISNSGVSIDGEYVNGVTMPSFVTSIGTDAFYNCSSLNAIQISEKVTSIGSKAFMLCTGIKEITVPSGVKAINGSVFQDCSSLKKVVLNGDVTSIGSKAFMNCALLADFVFPDTVSSINSEAFSGCKSLNSAIPMKVTTIGNKAFLGCAALDVALPTSATTIGTYVFQDCVSLGKTAKIILPAELTKVSDGMFKGCTSLPWVLIHDNIKSIGKESFSGCSATGFNKMSIPSSVTSVGSNAFNGCTSLATVSFAVSGCSKLADYVFANCTALTNISLPTTAFTSIGSNAFENCVNLTTITIPSSVTSIGSAAFKGCKSLNKVTLTTNSSFKTIDDQLFMNCEALENIEIPDSVTVINEKAFEGCKVLSNVTIPGSVTTLGNRAFYDCDALVYVVIPMSVEKFGSYTFAECTNLETVIFLSTSLLGSTSYFMHNCNNATIYCYENATSVINYAKKDGINYQATLAGAEGIFVVILKQPETITGAEIGKSYTLSAKVASEGILSYEWFVKNPGEKEFKSTGVTANKYTVNLTSENDGVQVMYKVKVTSPDDSSITAVTESSVAVVSTFGIPTVAADKVLDTEVALSWTKVDGATYYNVYRADSISGEKVLLGQVKDALTYVDSTVEPSTTYFYFVTAYSETLALESNYSNNVKVTTPDVITKPTVTAVPGDSQIYIEWNKIRGASSYRAMIYDGTSWKVYDTAETNYTFTDLSNGKAYKVAVKASIKGEFAEASDVVTCTPEVPNIIPQNVTASAGDTKVQVKWTAVAGASSYRVMVWDGTKWTGYNTTSTSYMVRNLINGKKYAFVVKAYVNGAYSANSEIVYATPFSAEDIIPTDVKAGAGDTKVQVKWTAVAGASSYRVMVWDGTKWTGYNTTSTSYMVRNLINGKKYAFVVKACVSGTYSANSETVYATPFSAEDIIPTDVKAGAGDTKVQVKWTAVAGASSYRVMVWDGTKWTGYNTTSTSYMVRNLINGKKYAFVVKAYVSGTYSANSEIVYATPFNAEDIIPTGVKAGAGDTKVQVKWTAVAGASSYRVMVWDGTKWTGYNTTSTSYMVRDLINGKKYAFVVKAYVSGTYSANSEIVYATPNA